MVLFLRPFSFHLLYCRMIVQWFDGNCDLEIFAGWGAKNSKQIQKQFYQDLITNILTKASTMRFHNSTADLCCLCLNGLVFQITSMKENYVDGLSLSLI